MGIYGSTYSLITPEGDNSGIYPKLLIILKRRKMDQCTWHTTECTDNWTLKSQHIQRNMNPYENLCNYLMCPGQLSLPGLFPSLYFSISTYASASLVDLFFLARFFSSRWRLWRTVLGVTSLWIFGAFVETGLSSEGNSHNVSHAWFSFRFFLKTRPGFPHSIVKVVDPQKAETFIEHQCNNITNLIPYLYTERRH